MKKTLGIISMLILSLVFLYLIRPKTSTLHVYDVFDTYSEITINSGKESILSECSDYLRKLDRLWSTTNQKSEISLLNNSKEYVTLSDETMDILKRSLDYSAKTDGYFDITVGASSALWNSAINSGILPAAEDVAAAAETIGYYSLSADGNKIFLKKDGASVTLGAIAKGYASDKLAEYLKSQNITSAMINLGGNVYALGRQKDGSLWNIGIQDPVNASEVIGAAHVSDSAVVTSGSYIRYFEHDGKRYHHIIDPGTGTPAESGLLSVTIISPDATTADVLSTACFIAGLREGISLIEKFNVMAIFVTEKGEVYYSKELDFTPQSADYKYKIIK